MIFEGDRSVIDAIKEKKRLMDAGEEHGHIRPLLVICGGLMKGVYGGGAVTAIHEEGYGEVFDSIIGISSGAPIASYFLGGNPRVGTSIYYEECCSKKFLTALHIKNWLTRPRYTLLNPLNISYINTIFHGETNKAIDTEKIFKSRTKLYIAVTGLKSVTSNLIHADTHEKLHTSVIASCDIPGLNVINYEMNGEVIVDGVVGSPFPLEFIKSLKEQPTHIVVMANRTVKGVSKSGTFFGWFLFTILLRKRANKEVRLKMIHRFKRFDLLFEQFKKHYNDSCVIWTDNQTKGLSVNSSRIKNTAKESEDWWRNLLAS